MHAQSGNPPLTRPVHDDPRSTIGAGCYGLTLTVPTASDRNRVDHANVGTDQSDGARSQTDRPALWHGSETSFPPSPNSRSAARCGTSRDDLVSIVGKELGQASGIVGVPDFLKRLNQCLHGEGGILSGRGADAGEHDDCRQRHDGDDLHETSVRAAQGLHRRSARTVAATLATAVLERGVEV